MNNYNHNMLPSNAESVDEVIRSLMRRENDTMERNFLRYRSVARDVFRDLNLGAIKYTERRLIEVDKNTNSIKLPCNYLKLSSISVIDECDKIHTLIHNKNLTDDIVDVSAKKDCGCECGCQDSLCGTVKNYEAIIEEVTEQMPDDSEKVFQKITRKILYPDGSLRVSYTYPIRKYTDGVWTTTEDVTDEEQICKLEVKKCGCLVNNDDNETALNACCNAENIQTDFGCTVCDDGSLEYNFSEQGDRIFFPSNFSFEKVLLRFYVESKVKEILVPLIAKSAYMAGLKFFASEYDDKVPQSRLATFKTGYNNKKDLLALDISKLTIAEVHKALIPKRNMV